MWPEESVRFSNREKAGAALAAEVDSYLRDNGFTDRPLVVGVPRGGVPVAAEVARAIGGDLDIVVVGRIGLPWQPEFGVGTVAEAGQPLIDHSALANANLCTSDLGPAVQRQRIEIARRTEQYRRTRPAEPVTGRLVILVDDGVNTGATARAALRALRAAEPAHLVFATPVCAADSYDGIRDEADAVVHVQIPCCSSAFGLWYKDFADVDDDTVSEILDRSWTAPASAG